MSPSLSPPCSVGCYRDFFVACFVFFFSFFSFFNAVKHSEGTVAKGSSDTLSLSMDGFL